MELLEKASTSSFFSIIDRKNVLWADWLDPLVDTISSAEFSTATNELAFTSTNYTTSTHVGWISPSTGNANTNYLFASKIFTAGGRVGKLPFRIKVGI